MDFCSMKRKELQALCKKNGIPANLSNVEMATRLAALQKACNEVKKQKMFRSCLKNLEIVVTGSDDEYDTVEVRGGKRVRFSPENETFLFEKTDPRELRLLARNRRPMAKSRVGVTPVLDAENLSNVDVGMGNLLGGCEVVAEDVGRNLRRREMVRPNAVFVDKDESIMVNHVEGDNPKRNLRSCASRTKQEGEEAALLAPCVEEKAKKGRKGRNMVEDGVVNKVDKPPDKVANHTGNTVMATRRSLRSAGRIVENLDKDDDNVTAVLAKNNLTKKNLNGESENVQQVPRRSVRRVVRAIASDFTSVSKGYVDDKSSSQNISKKNPDSCFEMASDSRKRKRTRRKAETGKHQAFEEVSKGAIVQKNVNNAKKPMDDDAFVGRKVVIEGFGARDVKDVKVLGNECLIRKSLRRRTKKDEKDVNFIQVQHARRSTRQRGKVKVGSSSSEQVADDDLPKSTDHMNQIEHKMSQFVNQASDIKESVLKETDAVMTDHTSEEQIIPAGAAAPDYIIVENKYKKLDEQSHARLGSSFTEKKTEKFDGVTEIPTNSSQQLHVAYDITKPEVFVVSNAIKEKVPENVEANSCSPANSEGPSLSSDCEAKSSGQSNNDLDVPLTLHIADDDKYKGRLVSTPTIMFHVSLAEEDCVDEPVCQNTTKPTSPESNKTMVDSGKFKTSMRGRPVSHSKNEKLAEQKNGSEESPGINEGCTIKNENLDQVMKQEQASGSRERCESVSRVTECCTLEVSDCQRVKQFVSACDANLEYNHPITVNGSRLVTSASVATKGEQMEETAHATKPTSSESNKTMVDSGKFKTSMRGRPVRHRKNEKKLAEQKNGSEDSPGINEGCTIKNEMPDQVMKQEQASGSQERCESVSRVTECCMLEVSDRQRLKQFVSSCDANLEDKHPNIVYGSTLVTLASVATEGEQMEEGEDAKTVTPLHYQEAETRNSSEEETNICEYQNKDDSDLSVALILPKKGEQSCEEVSKDLACYESSGKRDYLVESNKLAAAEHIKAAENTNDLPHPKFVEEDDATNCYKSEKVVLVPEEDVQSVVIELSVCASTVPVKTKYFEGSSQRAPASHQADTYFCGVEGANPVLCQIRESLQTSYPENIIFSDLKRTRNEDSEWSTITKSVILVDLPEFSVTDDDKSADLKSIPCNAAHENTEDVAHQVYQVREDSFLIAGGEKDYSFDILPDNFIAKKCCEMEFKLENADALSCKSAVINEAISKVEVKNDVRDAADQMELVEAASIRPTVGESLYSSPFSVLNSRTDNGCVKVNCDMDQAEAKDIVCTVALELHLFDGNENSPLEIEEPMLVGTNGVNVAPKEIEDEEVNNLEVASIIYRDDLAQERLENLQSSSCVIEEVPNVVLDSKILNTEAMEVAVAQGYSNLRWKNVSEDLLDCHVQNVNQTTSLNGNDYLASEKLDDLPSSPCELDVILLSPSHIEHGENESQACDADIKELLTAESVSLEGDHVAKGNVLYSIVKESDSLPRKLTSADGGTPGALLNDMHDTPVDIVGEKLFEALSTLEMECDVLCRSPSPLSNAEKDYEHINGKQDMNQAEKRVIVYPSMVVPQLFGTKEKVTDEVQGVLREASEFTFLLDDFFGTSEDNVTQKGTALEDEKISEDARMTRSYDLASEVSVVDNDTELESNGDQRDKLGAISEKVDELPSKSANVDEKASDVLMNDIYEASENSSGENLVEAASIREVGCQLLCSSPFSTINPEANNEGAEANCDAVEAKTEDIVYPAMTGPLSLGSYETEIEIVEGVLQDASAVSVSPLTYDSAGTSEHDVQKESEHEEVNYSDDACMIKSNDLASEWPDDLQSRLSEIAEVTEIDHGSSNHFEAECSADLGLSSNDKPKSDQQVHLEDEKYVEGHNLVSVEIAEDILPPSSPMINSRNSEAVPDLHDDPEIPSGHKMLVSEKKETTLTVLSNNPCLMPNQETSYKSFKENSEPPLENSISVDMDEHSFFNMPVNGGVLFNAVEDVFLDMVDHSVVENNLGVNSKEGEHDNVNNSVEVGDVSHIAAEYFSSTCEVGSESNLGGRGNSDGSSSSKVGAVSPRPCAFENISDHLRQQNVSLSLSTSEQPDSTETVFAASTGLDEHEELKCKRASCMFSSWEIDLFWGEMAKNDNSSSTRELVNDQTVLTDHTNQETQLTAQQVKEQEVPLNSSPEISDCTNGNINETGRADWLSKCPYDANNSDDIAQNIKDFDANDHVDNKVMSSIVNRANKRNILIHGTPRKQPLFAHDMKENTTAPKARQMVDVTAVKPMVKRRALEDICK